MVELVTAELAGIKVVDSISIMQSALSWDGVVLKYRAKDGASHTFVHIPENSKTDR